VRLPSHVGVTGYTLLWDSSHDDISQLGLEHAPGELLQLGPTSMRLFRAHGDRVVLAESVDAVADSESVETELHFDDGGDSLEESGGDPLEESGGDSVSDVGAQDARHEPHGNA